MVNKPSRVGKYLSPGTSLGGCLDVLGAETSFGGWSVESGKVHAVARAGFNEGSDCSIVPQLVSHPEEAAGQAGARLASFRLELGRETGASVGLAKK